MPLGVQVMPLGVQVLPTKRIIDDSRVMLQILGSLLKSWETKYVYSTGYRSEVVLSMFGHLAHFH